MNSLIQNLGWENTLFTLLAKKKSLFPFHYFPGDIVSCMSGYCICVICVDLGVWWVPIVWAVVSECLLAFFIRDGLLLAIIQLFFHVESIKKWQMGNLPERSSAKVE